ncbi:MAG: putative Nucleolar GTP-binding protein 1, partial [Streblomastix strix]
MAQTFGAISPVPTGEELVNIVLSYTQRKAPTEVHANFQIQRIRNFYMRKVKLAQQVFHKKMSDIVDKFPRLDDIHPFFADLLNVLYDKDHYKLALGQINMGRHLLSNIAKDYLKMLKHADSLYKAKQLKRAALGRMCTLVKKIKHSFTFLENVRQHLSRLPSINPTTRTLIVCGYPNVGKSSFVNKITHANVDVQPYAFTTKSLLLGHTDYKYNSWQVMDTPGILDHALEERNTIEMQSITALAHLQASILYFIDISGTCGYTLEQQVSLFSHIKPLFAGKPLIVVLSKSDLRVKSDLEPESQELFDRSILRNVPAGSTIDVIEMSCSNDEGVNKVKEQACERLLALRESVTMSSKKSDDILSHLHVAIPKVVHPGHGPIIPESVLKKRRQLNNAMLKDDEEDIDIDLELDQKLGSNNSSNQQKNKKRELEREKFTRLQADYEPTIKG